MGDGITGYSDEGCCELQGAACSKPDTLYEARVPVGMSFRRIYFLFSNSHKGGKCISIGEGIHTGPEWSVYHIVTATKVHHTCPEGTWILYLPYGCYPTWAFREKGGRMHTPTISLANEDPKGRHYDMAVKDDMIDSLAYAMNAKVEVRSAIGWYKSQLPKGVKKTVHSNYTEYAYGEKEVRKKMLQLIDVIFFNRKTKVVDYRKEIVAVDIEEAYMLAAQEYGKYNSKVHFRHAHCLFSFVDDNKEG